MPPAGSAKLPDSTGQFGKRILPLILLAGCIAFLFFYGLGSFGLVGADEPRYAQIAREMLARHDWVTPKLYGQVWLEKPVLYYWRAMVAFHFFGVNDASARLPSATFAGFMVAAIFGWMWRFRRGWQLDAALMTASSALIIGFARAASTDMSLAAPFTVAMLCWFGWYETHLDASTAGESRWWLSAFYVLVGLGTLAKGPVAPFLAALIIIAFAAVLRDWRIVLKTAWLPGILLFLAVALPWYIMVQIRNPEFLRVFIFEHNLERFGTNMFRHKQPFYFYLPVMLLAVVPWTFFVLIAMVDAVQKLRARFTISREHDSAVTKPGEAKDALPIFLLLWIVLPVLFFSISQSKLPGYILPSVPPCLILVADWLRRRARQDLRLPFWLAALHAAMASFLVAAIVLAPAQLLKRPAPLQALMLAAGLATVIFIAVALALLLKGIAYVRFATLLPVILAVGLIIRTVAPVVNITQSERPVAEAISAYPKVATFKAKREVEYGLAWYRNQPISVYERLEIPLVEHLVVGGPGAEADLKEILPGRTVTRVGGFAPQRLGFFLVTAAR